MNAAPVLVARRGTGDGVDAARGAGETLLVVSNGTECRLQVEAAGAVASIEAFVLLRLHVFRRLDRAEDMADGPGAAGSETISRVAEVDVAGV
jgi:hypothetical protein